MAYEPVIGLEVHAQLKTKTKLFSPASTEFGMAPNANIAPVCLALPGTLPVLNKTSVALAIRAGLALNCEIRNLSVFSRKNYFYADLPKGYQISQYDLPICENGHLDITVDKTPLRVGITRIHMEEDAGKLVHQGADAIAGSTGSLVDLNRAGVPLIEIVSEPDIRNSKQARAYMEQLKILVQHLGICDGNLEEGSLRCDANISLRPVGTEKFGTRAEVKNINSFRSLERAIEVEILRQTEILDQGGTVIQETRNYDDVKQITTSLRSKEDAHDYRYFPEPDLPPLRVSDSDIEEIKAQMPELPQAKMARYQADLGLSKDECRVFLSDVAIDQYFEACLACSGDIKAKSICKWVVGDVIALNKANNVSISDSHITPKRLVSLVGMIEDQTISGKMAKDLLAQVIEKNEDPKALLEESGGGQIQDSSELQVVVDRILDENPDVIEKVKAGKTNSANFLMGQVMKETGGKAKPDLVRSLILDTIKAR